MDMEFIKSYLPFIDEQEKKNQFILICLFKH